MNERAIFVGALDRDTPADRAAYLDEACAGDPALRARVDALLRSHEEAGEFPGKLAPQRLADEFADRESDDARTGPSGPDAEGSLDFLEPSDKSGSLGRLKHYEVQEVVGRGGMGIVLRAFDETLHRVIAVKVMAPQLAASASARQRFTREARAAAAVTHDHIVTIHAVEETNGLPCIVMQYVNGLSLQDRIDQTGPLSLREVLRIGMQTARGLAAAHAQGLVHRDVKPANILLENGVERVKLTDFGLARAADDAILTQSGVVAGTPSFMSPEQAEGRPVDHRSDLFSLGSVLYAMCTGRPPFRAGTSMGVLKRVCEDTPSPIREINPEIPDWLAAVVEKLHAKDPAARYQSAEEVAELLGQHLAHVQHPSVVPMPVVVKPASEPSPVRTQGRNRWGVAAAMLVAVFAALGTAEATGVTQVRATVTRIFTTEGTLVVETDDPGVKVTVEGDGDLVITGAGAQEVRLRAGSYRVHAVKDGKPVKLDRDLVTISRGDRAIVRVRLEGDVPTAAVPTVVRGAFVLMAGNGIAERKFDTLAEAVLRSTDGDTIEVHGNGPFVIETVKIQNRALTIRAAAGYRPILRLSSDPAAGLDLIVAKNAPLTIEGLEFRRDDRHDPKAKGPKDEAAIRVYGAPIHVANCRFVMPQRNCVRIDEAARRCVLTNCEFVDGWAALSGIPASANQWVIDNSVKAGNEFVSAGITSPNQKEASIRVSRSSLAGGSNAFYMSDAFRSEPPQAVQVARSVRLEISGCVLDVFTVLVTAHKETLGSDDTKDRVTRLLDWRGRENLYDVQAKVLDKDAGFLMTLGPTGQNPWSGPRDLQLWGKFWGSTEAGSMEGRVRYEGGDLAARAAVAPEELTPKDFRLRPDSIGYRAGKDGKDIGADVDLVGPGPAYERWKKTPDYQQWLKETGQLKE